MAASAITQQKQEPRAAAISLLFLAPHKKMATEKGLVYIGKLRQLLIVRGDP